MQIQRKQTTEVIDYMNQTIMNKKQIIDVDSNHIRDKLRKNKPINKQVQQKNRNKVININIKNKSYNKSKKPINSVKFNTSSKPIIKSRKQIDRLQCQKTVNSQQKLENFLNNQIHDYIPKSTYSLSKDAIKSSKKCCDSSIDMSIEEYMNKINNENEIKLISLLQQRQKLLFKNSLSQQISEYQSEALQFLFEISDKQLQKQNNNVNYNINLFNNPQQSYQRQNNVLKQKMIQLILQSKQVQSNSSIFAIRANSDKQIGSRDELSRYVEQISYVQKQYLTQMKTFEKIWLSDIGPKIKQPLQLKYITKILLVLAKCYKNNHNQLNKLLNKIKSKQQSCQFKQYQTNQYNDYHFNKYNDCHLNKSKDHYLNNKLLRQPQSTNQLNHKQFYIKCLIKKNLIKSFSQQQNTFQSNYQLWNYFKYTYHLQQNIINQGYRDHQQYIPLSSHQQYIEYIKRVKNKKIIYKPTLYTPCKACFSNHTEKYNPILKCPDCKFRLHKYCGKIQQKCDKCQYKKLGSTLKSEIQKCFICHNETNSLMLHKIKSDKYVHNFCMLVHNLWAISNQQLVYDSHNNLQIQNDDSTKSLESIKQNIQPSKIRKSSKQTSIVLSQKQQVKQSQSQQMIEQSQQFIMNQCKKDNKKCKFCAKGSQSQIQYLKKCSKCNQTFHILCAYLNGCFIEITQWKHNFQISLVINCCCQQQSKQEFEQKRKNRQFCRKYKINYEKHALNYGFESQIKTTKNIQSQNCSFQQIQEEQQKLLQIETQKYGNDNFSIPVNFDIVQMMNDEL